MAHSAEWVTAAISEGDGTVDIVSVAQAVLAEHGCETERRGHDLELAALGLTFSPRGLEIASTKDGRIRTASIVRSAHPAAFPAGLFEYQHGFGADLRASLRFGLDQWAQIDVPVLCDALRETPEVCTMLQMTFPAEDGRPERTRRAILGPTAHFAELAASKTDQPDSEEKHPFCPCCLTTNCMEAFMPLFQGDATVGLRLFATRDASGEAMADCRVNGEDFEEGKAALRAYAETWPRRGYEFRKQYVIIQPGR